jgi:ketosteroid isomerase-like protein
MIDFFKLKFFSYSFLFVIVLSSCDPVDKDPPIEQWKQEIKETEWAFAKMAGEEGIYNAFISFAADDAVLMRDDQLIKGISNIDQFYKTSTAKGLQWTPEYVDVSRSGDLGYTYGYYTFDYLDSLGNKAQRKGVFHTVWKRQVDGSWKFVWD